MKAKQLIIITLLITALVLALTGCEYDVAEPQWDKDHFDPIEPRITGIVPADIAPPGINYIIINGENFAPTLDSNNVYFSGEKADIVSGSSSSITVRRPTVTGDSVTISVASYGNLIVAKQKSYIIDTVMVRYGNFINNTNINAIAVDDQENLYVCLQDSFQYSIVYKVTPDESKLHNPISVSTDTTRPNRIWEKITESKVFGDKLIMLKSDSLILQMDLTGGVPSKWATIKDATGKNMKVVTGDFDSEQNFYTAGNKTGVYIVRPGNTVGEDLGVHISDNILAMRVYNGYLYLYIKFGRGSAYDNGIYRYQILAGGGLSTTMETVLIWDNITTDGYFADTDFITFTIASDGRLIIGTNDATDALMEYDTGSKDIFYKDILPPYPQKLVWGQGNYLYMIIGGSSSSEQNIVRIDMGAAGAAYHGRE